MFFEDEKIEAKTPALHNPKKNVRRDDSAELVKTEDVFDAYDVCAARELFAALQDGPVTIGPYTIVSAVISSDGTDQNASAAPDIFTELLGDNQEEEEKEIVKIDRSIAEDRDQDEQEALIAELEEILTRIEEVDEPSKNIEESLGATAASLVPEMPSECAGGCSSEQQLALARRALMEAQKTIASVVELLELQIKPPGENDEIVAPVETGMETRHGVYVGEHMFGNDGKYYQVPANYASKSRLVEGDLLKLSILPNGSHIYSQIGPVERLRLKATLMRGTHGGWEAHTERGRYRLLDNSVNYHRGKEGHQVVVLVPKGLPARHAAIETILKNIEHDET